MSASKVSKKVKFVGIDGDRVIPMSASASKVSKKVKFEGIDGDISNSHHSIRGDTVLDSSSTDFAQVGNSTVMQRRPCKMLANDANPGAGRDEKVTSGGNGRDLSPSIRGDPVDFVQAKKSVGNSTAVQRLICKVLPKLDKPQWLTVFSIFAINFVLLVLLLGLVQLIRGLALKSGETAVRPELGLVEFERRIADVESLLKTTAKMIQVQVDFVDRIENEIGGLRKEMNKKIDDQGAILVSELRKLESKSEGLERSLGEEFQKLYDELKKSKGADLGEASLDEIKTYAREIIEKEIQKHAADGLDRVDYALASGGAKVVKHSEIFVGGGMNWFLPFINNVLHTNSDKLLKPSFGEPGQCFSLKGSSGFVQIKLRTAIIPESVTLEHVAKSVAYDRSTAPKGCRVFGWLKGRNSESVIKTEKMFLLIEFTYDLEKSNAQTFDMSDSGSTGPIDTVRLDFTSNHGSPLHTCIYRFRVHGHEPNAVSDAMRSL